METDLPFSRNIKLTVSYDGTDFLGWQCQNENGKATGRTVQGEIEKALEKMHGHGVSLIGSGRTDSGVHALGQVANFHTDIRSIPALRFIPALNSMLPKDVRILESNEVASDFHARFDARRRTYKYYIHCGARPYAHEMPYIWHLGYWPDLRLLNSLASCLSGELDCSAFAASGDSSHTRSRYLYSAFFYPEGEKIVFEISANAFLWRMVRSIVGTLIDLEKRAKGVKDFQEIIHSKDRSMAGPTAPGTGLFLSSVQY